jgi:hypothetical protein
MLLPNKLPVYSMNFRPNSDITKLSFGKFNKVTKWQLWVQIETPLTSQTFKLALGSLKSVSLVP